VVGGRGQWRVLEDLCCVPLQLPLAYVNNLKALVAIEVLSAAVLTQKSSICGSRKLVVDTEQKEIRLANVAQPTDSFSPLSLSHMCLSPQPELLNSLRDVLT
jgi:hypothetical protein